MDNYDSLPCGVLITDQHCNIHYCNNQFLSAIQSSINDIVDSNLDTLLSNGSKILFQQLVLPSVINQVPVNEVQLNFLDADNKKLPMVVFAKRDDANSDRIFWNCFPAIERDKLMDALNQSRNQLEEANEQLKILSKTDDLTGCDNRREMLLKLGIIRRQMQRSQSSFSLMMLDLDFFKKVNDNYGHAEGDYVLKQFAHMLMDNARFDDVVARYGGEEFILILPNTNPESAMIAAKRVHENMKEIQTKAEAITVSIGVFVVPFDSDISDGEIIAVADKTLYASKETGRNKTTLRTIPPLSAENKRVS